MSFHLPFGDSAVSVVLSGAFAPFLLPRLPRLVRRGADGTSNRRVWDDRGQLRKVSLSEVNLVSALLVVVPFWSEPLIAKVGLFSII